jgi:hypothetical protein
MWPFTLRAGLGVSGRLDGGRAAVREGQALVPSPSCHQGSLVKGPPAPPQPSLKRKDCLGSTQVTAPSAQQARTSWES